MKKTFRPMLKSLLVKFARRCYNNGFVAGWDGNLSARKKNGKILITGSGVNKGNLARKDICTLDLFGNKLSGTSRASTESKMHLAIYRQRKDVKAIVHCHPVFATALATAGVDINLPIFPEVILGLGKIIIAEYATPSTNEVEQSFLSHLSSGNCIILKNHGAVTLGTSIEEAYFRMETLEHAMRMYFVMLNSGTLSAISNEQLKKLYALAHTVYGISISDALKLSNNV